jgi:hypothetical protein
MVLGRSRLVQDTIILPAPRSRPANPRGSQRRREVVPEIQELILQRTGGNPLFAEERL